MAAEKNMSRQEDRVTLRQAKRMVLLETFGTGALFMPVAAAQIKNGSGMTMVIGVLCAFLLGAYLIWVSAKQNCAAGAGGAGERAVQLIYALRFWFRGVVLLYIFGQMVRRFLLPDSSMFFILLPVILVAGYTMLRTVKGRGRLLEMIFWWILAPIILIWILAVSGWHLGTLEGQRFSAVGDVPEQTLLAVCRILLFYLPLESVLYFMPRWNVLPEEELREISRSDSEKRRYQSAAMAGLVTGLLMNVAVFAMAFLTVGEKALAENFFGVANMLQTISAPGNVITRLDIIVMPFLILGLFIIFSGSIFYGCMAWEQVISRRTLLFPAIILISAWAFASLYTNFDNVLVWYEDYGVWVDLPLAFLLPLLMLWMGRGKQKKKSPAKQQSDGAAKRKEGTKAAAKNVLLAGSLIITAAVFCGCDKVDIEDRDYVLMLGIDQADSETALKRHTHAYAVAMADMQGYKAEAGEAVKIKTAEDTKNSLRAFRDSYSRNHAATMDFGHVELLLFHESLTEDDDVFEDILEAIEEERLLSGTILVAVTREAAADYIRKDEEMDVVLSQAIANMLKKEGNVSVTLQELYLAEDEDRRVMIPVLEFAGEDVPQVVDYAEVK